MSLTRCHRIFPRDLFKRRDVILFVSALSRKVKRRFIRLRFLFANRGRSRKFNFDVSLEN